jgi:hypothetical protein
MGCFKEEARSMGVNGKEINFESCKITIYLYRIYLVSQSLNTFYPTNFLHIYLSSKKLTL